jgi:hypothetical protein
LRVTPRWQNVRSHGLVLLEQRDGVEVRESYPIQASDSPSELAKELIRTPE